MIRKLLCIPFLAILAAGCSRQQMQDIGAFSEQAIDVLAKADRAGLQGRLRVRFDPTGSFVVGAGGGSYVGKSEAELEVWGNLDISKRKEADGPRILIPLPGPGPF